MNSSDEIKDEAKTDAKVRRLSLFDTVNQDEENSSLNNEDKLRAEPIISSNIDDEEENLEENLHDNPDSEIGGEESEANDLEEEFNQETEELLDIPTFLRRQAN